MRGLKNIGCYLFENSTLPTINTFIILDIILRILKIRRNKKKKEKTKKNNKKTKLKRALLLTNKTLIDLFPPDYDFILNFLNNSLDRRKDNNNENIWTVNKIKNYKNLYRNFKDDKKYNIKNNNQNEERNSLYINDNHICNDIYNQHICNLKIDKHTNDTSDKLHITIDELKNILNFIHIKYIDEENYLINLLYKLNEHKKYNIIVINISFLFIKDDKKIKIFLDYILSSTSYKNITKELTMKSKDKNNSDHKNEYFSNTNKVIYSNIEAEICDHPFYKNILNIYFHYSYFINFFEYLNSVSHFSLTRHNINKIQKKKKKIKTNKKNKINDNNNDNDNNNNDNNIISESSNKCNIISYHHHQNDDERYNYVERKNKRSYFTYLLKQNHSANLHSSNTTHDKKKIKFEHEEKYEYNENDNNMNDNNQNNSCYNHIFQSNNIPNNNTLSNVISPYEKEINFLSNQLKSHKQIDVTEKHIEEESTKGCLSIHSIKLKKIKKKIRTNLYLFDMIPKSNIYKKMYMDIILMNFNHLYVISRNI
ncbi:conserved Plasmodium protein, unknown function [Plasmodium sp. gorilla clade G3]|nr:conserved Plasmodium protein, unknown function [Plasmodium sp. gorilla clade G3]